VTCQSLRIAAPVMRRRHSYPDPLDETNELH
jgi:hypothetical protein